MEKSSLLGAITDEESSLSEEESTTGELNRLSAGLTVASLLWETKYEAEGVTTSSSGIFVDSGTSSERASDNEAAMD